MGWVRLDDGLCMHIKTFTVLDLDSIGLWTLCLAFCAHELTDGFVPDEYIVARVPRRDPAKTVAKLIAAGWMEKVEGGYCIPQYLDYNPSRAEVEENRERVHKQRSEAGKRGAEARWRGKTDGKRHGSPPSVRHDARQSTVHGPVPIPPSSLQEENVPNPEHVRLAELLGDLIEGNGSKRPSVKNWDRDVRLMVERDGRSLEQVEAAIRWCQADEFWKGNVMSMGKLRKQYDKLRLAAARERKTTKPAWERQAKVVALGTGHTCRRCPAEISNEQANNQSGMCDDCYAKHIENLTGEAA